MNLRAFHLADALGGQLADLGPGVRTLSVDDLSTWQIIRIGAASSDDLRRLAEDLELDQAQSLRHGRTWWRQMALRPSGAIVMSAHVHREVRP